LLYLSAIAGALISTVDDLAAWTAALNSGKVVSEKSLQLMYTPVKLNNGEAFPYGFGFSLGEFKGRRMIYHGGGIRGFVASALYIPRDDVFAAVLSNRDGGAAFRPQPHYISRWIAAALIGSPYKDWKTVKLDPRVVDTVVGIYKVKEDHFRVIKREGERIFAQESGGNRKEIFPASEREFFSRESNDYFTFIKDKDGKVVKMVKHTEKGDEEAVKTGKKPAERKVVRLAAAVLDSLAGRYKFPEFELDIFRQGERLFGKMAYQDEADELFAESETEFFAKTFDGRFIFKKDETGKVTAVVVFLGKDKLDGKKVL
ncbi:MAG: DUF3471 domain-containing protein, partial [Candidatus Aminicenantes bacterium]|nr:DUF3471 domain-containing protein [Candidatus Aminicenantes bacterium]